MSLRGSAGCWEESGSPCPPPGPGRPAPLALGADSHSTESQCDASLRTNSRSPLELFLWDPRDEPQGRRPESAERACLSGLEVAAGSLLAAPLPAAQPSKPRTVGPGSGLPFPFQRFRTPGFPPAVARASFSPHSPRWGWSASQPGGQARLVCP